MTHRTHLVLTASLAAALAAPGLASANGTLACDGASYTGYPAGQTTGALRLVMDGETFAQAQVTIAAPRTTVALPYALTGTHTISLWFDGYGEPLLIEGPVAVDCGPAATGPAPDVVVTLPGSAATPGGTVVWPKEGGRKAPSRAQASSSRYRVVSTRCRIFSRRPANAVSPTRTPGLAQVRVRRGTDGRWAGFRDRHRVTWVNGKITSVAFKAGEYCGRTAPAVLS